MLDLLHDVDAADVRHLQVDDRQVDVALAQLLVHLAAVGDGGDAVAILLQDLLDQLARVLVVIDDEYSDVHRNNPALGVGLRWKSNGLPNGPFLAGRRPSVNQAM